jgi:undecaprenyl-diphosphatase
VLETLKSLLITFSLGSDWHAIEVEWLKQLNLSRFTPFDPFFQFISNSVSYVAWGIPLLLLVIGLFRKQSNLHWNFLFVWISVLFASLITLTLKYVILRPRPFESYEFIEKLSTGGSPSFPSGHTTDAFAFAVALILAYPRWYVILPSLVWAIMVGYSRMSLGVHYPSDVLFGIIIGSASAYVCYRLSVYFSTRSKLTARNNT